MNGIVILLAAGLIPLAVGALWYGPLFGKSWMRANNFTEEDLKGGNMAMIFGLTYILGIMLAFGISSLTNHQSGVDQLFLMHPDYQTAGTEVGDLYKAVMDKFGNTHRSFGHGALHGVLGSILLFLPLISINALFERRGRKYIFIHWGYWAVTSILIGGVVCQWF